VLTRRGDLTDLPQRQDGGPFDVQVDDLDLFGDGPNRFPAQLTSMVFVVVGISLAIGSSSYLPAHWWPRAIHLRPKHSPTRSATGPCDQPAARSSAKAPFLIFRTILIALLAVVRKSHAARPRRAGSAIFAISSGRT